MIPRKCHLPCLAALIVVMAGCDPSGEENGSQPVREVGAPPQAGKGDKKPPTTVKGEMPKAPTAKVEKGPIKLEVACKGIIEAKQMTEVRIKPDAWAMGLSVEKAVAHGAKVKKGDQLVWLDMEKIDQAIKEFKADMKQSELALKLAEDEMPILEKSLPLDMAAAERGKKQSDEDLKKFLEVDKLLMIESAEHMAKSSAHYLEYAQEELKQLEKMYRTKDLTEETEEIVLKRQRHQVESAQFGLKASLIQRDQTLKVDVPRREQAMKDGAIKQTLALEKTKNSLPLSLNQKTLALAKMKYDFQKTTEKLAKLERDREAMSIKAPADGIVYYGKCVKGSWSSAGMEAMKLQKGGNLTPDDVFMTILTPNPSFLRSSIEEKDLHLVQAGMKGKVIPTAYPDLKLPVTLTEISSIPQPGGAFEALIQFGDLKGSEKLVPGLNCAINFVAYQKNDALTVPASAVFTDDADNTDEGAHYVYVPGKDGMNEKKTVKVGKSANGKMEIVDGLKEGDEILTSKP